MSRGLLVGDLIDVAAQRTPERIAASLEGQTITYAELARQSHRLAEALVCAGVEVGDRVVWRSETSFETVILYFATALTGSIFVPVNPRMTDEEAARIMDHCEPRLTLGDKASGDEGLQSLLARNTGGQALPDVHEDDVHVIFYTSGTTGEPKGCMLSHRTERLRAPGKAWPEGVSVCMFPQFHMAGWGRPLSVWTTGGEVAYVARAEAENLMNAVHHRQATEMYCIPAVWQRILDSNRTGIDLSSLERLETGTSAVTDVLLRDLGNLVPSADISVHYGSTEAGSVCVAGPADIRLGAGSVGHPSPGVFVKLDETQEMMVTSSFLFSGYFRNEVANEKALEGGWYRTGDLARRDEHGRYHIVGRAGDMIRTGGEAVAPAEVEVVLRLCPSVEDVAVIGVPDATWGEIVTAFVAPVRGATPTLEQLREHCGGKLAVHKHPRRLILVDSIPKTGATGQVQRRLLLAQTK